MSDIEKSKVLVKSIIKLTGLTYDLNMLVSNLKKIYSDNTNLLLEIENLESIVNNINSETDILYINRPRKLVKTESKRQIDIEINPQTSESLEEDFLQCVTNIDFKSINFNSLNYDTETLISIVYEIFDLIVNLNKIKIDKISLKKLIGKISKYYHLNPFHNFKHAVMVFQFAFLLLNEIEKNGFIIDDLYKFALLIAALVHDIDHPGNTNSFEINSNSLLAKKYNNSSVLENHHCSTAFYLFQLKGIELFKNLEINEYNTIRECIIECIISTDMINHNDLINLLKSKEGTLNWSIPSNLLLLCKFVVHCADLSNQSRPFEIAKAWSECLVKEFKNQVSTETKLKLESIEFMKINGEKSFFKSEYNFSQYVVLPLFSVLVDLFPFCEHIKQSLNANIKSWNDLFCSV
jgi:hypothetical protein